MHAAVVVTALVAVIAVAMTAARIVAISDLVSPPFGVVGLVLE
ncbi:hypothetical protein [Natrinema sp. DC36]